MTVSIEKIGREVWPSDTRSAWPTPTDAKPSYQGSGPSIFGQAWLGLQHEMRIVSTVYYLRNAILIHSCIIDSKAMLRVYMGNFKSLLICFAKFHCCWLSFFVQLCSETSLVQSLIDKHVLKERDREGRFFEIQVPVECVHFPWINGKHISVVCTFM